MYNCTDRVRDKSGNIVSYKLVNHKGEHLEMASDEVKKLLSRTPPVKILHLTLTSDNRVIYTADPNKDKAFKEFIDMNSRYNLGIDPCYFNFDKLDKMPYQVLKETEVMGRHMLSGFGVDASSAKLTYHISGGTKGNYGSVHAEFITKLGNMDHEYSIDFSTGSGIYAFIISNDKIRLTLLYSLDRMNGAGDVHNHVKRFKTKVRELLNNKNIVKSINSTPHKDVTNPGDFSHKALSIEYDVANMLAGLGNPNKLSWVGLLANNGNSECPNSLYYILRGKELYIAGMTVGGFRIYAYGNEYTFDNMDDMMKELVKLP